MGRGDWGLLPTCHVTPLRDCFDSVTGTLYEYLKAGAFFSWKSTQRNRSTVLVRTSLLGRGPICLVEIRGGGGPVTVAGWMGWHMSLSSRAAQPI
jgi:hypothetical protein